SRHATVTTCHTRTVDLPSVTSQADILVAAAGKAGLVTKDMVKPGAVVIDVGTNFVDGKTVGDVDFEAVKDVAGMITPVPGGVGPVTTATLFENVIEATKKNG
ncbi:MAG: bifunctional 5,10-methylene-tetrahydrofolate dehydrogenase/5,10-methylene-tetrahydrofolate cyclohydrolase, partial [candidate division WOR-3 bacterium]